MAEVDGPSGRYRIDVTEVTEREYARFLRCGSHVLADRSCVTVTDHSPCAESGFDAETAGELPVRCVSWCSAAAYCLSVGRRLCRLDEWMDACVSTRDRIAPRGTVREARACVLSAFADGMWGNDPADVVAPVGSAPDCRGASPPFDTVLDVVGNAEEMVGECEDDGCIWAGGSYRSGPGEPCVETEARRRLARDDHTGFRCCAD